VRVVEDGVRELARGSVSGPRGTDLRFSLRGDSSDIEALFRSCGGDHCAGLRRFFTKRRLAARAAAWEWEQDSYLRAVAAPWATLPASICSGARGGQARAGGLWVEVALERGSPAEGRPAEELQVADSTTDIRLDGGAAAPRPVVMNLVRATR